MKGGHLYLQKKPVLAYDCDQSASFLVILTNSVTSFFSAVVLKLLHKRTHSVSFLVVSQRSHFKEARTQLKPRDQCFRGMLEKQYLSLSLIDVYANAILFISLYYSTLPAHENQLGSFLKIPIPGSPPLPPSLRDANSPGLE